jgi:hypothetical protein
MLYVGIAVAIVVGATFIIVPMERAQHRRKLEMMRRRIERREQQLAHRDAGADGQGERGRR